MYAGRIYADFQNLDDENRVRLDCAGTQRDIAASAGVLREGQRVGVYTDDAGDDGNADPLLADGVLERGDDGKLAARIDWQHTRNASQELHILKKRFFDTAIGDTLRALDGQSLIGATTLALCVLDHLGYLRSGQGEQNDFCAIVQQYLTTANVGYDPQWLWDVRCGLVHVHGRSRADVEGKQPVGVIFTHLKPDLHLKVVDGPGRFGKLLNVDSFIVDVIRAAWEAFQEFAASPETPLEMYPRLLIVGQADAAADKQYGAMHYCLAPLDAAQFDPGLLLVAVQRMLREGSPRAA